MTGTIGVEGFPKSVLRGRRFSGPWGAGNGGAVGPFEPVSSTNLG